jgi:hypothetical protein
VRLASSASAFSHRAGASVRAIAVRILRGICLTRSTSAGLILLRLLKPAAFEDEDGGTNKSEDEHEDEDETRRRTKSNQFLAKLAWTDAGGFG